MQVTSFRMVDGRVRNLRGHFDRLGATPEIERRIRAQLIDAPALACNPLVRANGDVLIRPDRPFTPFIEVDPEPHADLRGNPTVKGPDLDWLACRLALSKERGYDEGLLSHNGKIVEGIFSAIIHFRGSEAHYSVHPRALASTTLPPVLEYLHAKGIRCTGVLGLDVNDEPNRLWLLNAFSGVRSAQGPDPTEVNTWLWNQAESVEETT